MNLANKDVESEGHCSRLVVKHTAITRARARQCLQGAIVSHSPEVSQAASGGAEHAVD